VRDRGAPGGELAEWVVDRSRQALSASGATLGRLPQGWGGASLPKGIHGVLRGKVTAVQSERGQDVMFELHWDVIYGEGREFSPSSLRFAQQIGPLINPKTRMPEPEDARLLKQDQVSLRFDTREGGGLCEGQQTKVFIETKQPLHVRVLNISGDGELGTLIYASDGLVQPGRPVSLGEFIVTAGSKVPVERFIVTASDHTSGLGPFAPALSYCRLNDETTERLHRGSGLPTGPKSYVFSTGYRIMSGEECKQHTPVSPQVVAEAEAAIRALALCPGM
jgi:hypothetical protein